MRKRVYAPKSRTPAKRSYKKNTKFFPGQAVSLRPISAPTKFNFPQVLYADLLYAEPTFTLDVGVGGLPVTYLFNLSSLFDPNITGVGHQPAGFDQIAAMYEEYLVMSVDYKVCIWNNDTGNQMLYGITINDEGTAQSDLRVIMENGNTQWDLVSTKNGAGTCISKYSGHVDLATAHGQTKATFNSDPDNWSLFSTGPNDNMFMHIWACPQDGIIDTTVSRLSVTLQYHCQFRGGKFTPLS